jgi:uncharacterized protein YndB with AHSA1/START domain
MSASDDVIAGTPGREMHLSRIYDAPRELVFKMWTDPKHLAQWWGPNGFTTTTHEIDVRPGGVWRFIMHGPDGRDYNNKIIYIEIVPPERLVYRHAGDADTEPVRFHTTVTFTDRGGKTELTMQAVFESVEARDNVIKNYGALEGGKQTLGRLGQYLAQLKGRVG